MNENDFDDGLRQLLVCTYGDDCARVSKERHGSATAIYDALKAARNEAGLKRKLYVVRTSCQGWCQYAPVCSVLPEGRVFHDLRPEEAASVVQAMVQRDENSLKDKKIWDFSLSRDENYRSKGQS